ncbi:MAG TPA: ribbon-helix-helix domain-containing protein [Methanolinea sp.]|jgi:metal-responsive CopG/Arc/MetJ family transcriptional regulator|nr:ribbon-helix-helix domain-containing protein [Methanolinea sp.]HOS81383.1 ribbon-helix-helix domain-containing protein [Methanolinea sp.]HPC54707.1 ribbon-helix-helix domain-containing protein [Methanolinea sp.]HQE85073.1 ribbon-helix-helix domain-containing protein [Methanolinea sp.]HQI13947.1 ribbon-helix-helix domain-containing protein [Methanolinea sp.]
MPIRLSITIDSETIDQVDKFAKEQGFDRNRAILECIRAGIQKVNAGEQVNISQTTRLEDYKEIRAILNNIDATLKNLVEEIRVMHHTIEAEWLKENRTVPYQSRKWYEFWKT